MRIYSAIVLVCFLGSPVYAQKAETYHSPYEVKFQNKKSELLADIEKEKRGDGKAASTIPYEDWYSDSVREKWKAWGPPVKHFPAAKIVEGKSAEWRRERVIAVALQYVGYEYQHHHVPDWSPTPADWPWIKVSKGKQGCGLDCSNYSKFCYMMAFGIKFSSDIHVQEKKLDLLGPDKKESQAERIEIPTAYAEFSKKLKTGDLLFIKGAPDKEVTHVVVWVGKIGSAPGDVPLLLDARDSQVIDTNKNPIPTGIQLRPFAENSWYHKSASHAHRIIKDE